MRIRRTAWTCALAVSLAVGGLIGCTNPTGATIAVERAELAPGRQLQKFEMQTRQAAWAEGADGTCRALLGFPLPGSISGRPSYYLYLRFPSAKKVCVLSPGCPEQVVFVHASRTAGEPNQRWDARYGQFVIKWATGQYRIRGFFELSCAAGPNLTGRFNAIADAEAVEEFEESYLKLKIARKPEPVPPPSARPASPPPATAPDSMAALLRLAARQPTTFPDSGASLVLIEPPRGEQAAPSPPTTQPQPDAPADAGPTTQPEDSEATEPPTRRPSPTTQPQPGTPLRPAQASQPDRCER